MSLSRAVCKDVKEWNDLSTRKAKAKQKFGGKFGSDLIGSLAMYETLVSRSHGSRAAKCFEHGISPKRLQLLEATVRQIVDRLQDLFPTYQERLSTLREGRVKFMRNLAADPNRIHVLRLVILGTFQHQLLVGAASKGYKKKEVQKYTSTVEFTSSTKIDDVAQDLERMVRLGSFNGSSAAK